MEPSVSIFSYILDDDKDTLDLLSEILKKHNINNYTLFQKPEDFLTNIGSEIIVCLIDLLLSNGMTGLDVIKAVKAKNNKSFVIVMSGLENYKMVIDCLNAGADRYIDKNNPNYLTKFILYMQEGLIEAEKKAKLFNFLNKRLQDERLTA